MFKYIQFKVSKSKCAAIILEISRLKFPSTLVSHPICNNVSFYCHIFMFFIDSYNYFIIINWQPLWLEEEASIRIILCRKSLWCVKLVSTQQVWSRKPGLMAHLSSLHWLLHSPMVTSSHSYIHLYSLLQHGCLRAAECLSMSSVPSGKPSAPPYM